MGAENDRAVRRSAGVFAPLVYLRSTTNLFNSLVLIVPVFVLYQAGISYQLWKTPEGSFAINGADYLTRLILKLCGGSLLLYLVFVAFVGAGFVFVLLRRAQREKLAPRVYLPMLVESTVYALLFATTIHLIQSVPQLLAAGRGLSALAGPTSTWEMVFQSLGAGFNEELVFRLGLLGGIVLVGHLIDLPRTLVIAAAFLFSSLAFSAFHYIGPYADILAFDSFMYRFLAGILLATIYWWRGLAVAVYTHAIYDLYFFLVLSSA